MNAAQQLLRVIEQRAAKVGVIGLGYVGLPLSLRFAAEGFSVLGFDVDSGKAGILNTGQSYIDHIPAAAVAQANSQGFHATTDFSEAAGCDALIICVPTPLNERLEPDLSFVRGTLDSLQPHLRAGQLISLESTTYPGTTREEVLPRLADAGLQLGEVHVVYSPEREDPGNANFSTQTIPKLVGGVTEECLRVGRALYEAVIDEVVPLSSTDAAEMTKLLENIHRAVNIGLVNEMKLVADRMGIDIFEVVDAAATKPFGFTPYYPGPGLGGHCIPIDPFYLTWKAREYGVETRFIELAGQINRAMPAYVIAKLVDALHERGKAISESRVLVLGLAYKKNVGDSRESPAVEILALLEERGANIAYSDPFVPEFPAKRDYSFELSSETLSPENIAAFDAVVLVTDHDAFDYAAIASHAQLIVDTRGRYRAPKPNIVKA